MATIKDWSNSTTNPGSAGAGAVRPLPRRFPLRPGGWFVLCQRTLCRGEQCTYAHSVQEKEAWNAQLKAERTAQRGQMVQLRPMWQHQREQQLIPGMHFHGPIPPLSPQCLPPWLHHSPNRMADVPSASRANLPGPIAGTLRPPSSNFSPPVWQTRQHGYAAQSLDFLERITELLDETDVQQPLTRTNYKEKFHKLLCWEEKKHIEILKERCNGKYKLVVYQTGFKPPWICPERPVWRRFGHIEGMDGDQIAYATQASEAAFIPHAPDTEIEVEIFRENFSHTDEKLYIAFSSEGVNVLKQTLSIGNGVHEFHRIEFQFEVKHSYFNNLHKAISGLSPEVIAKLLPEDTDFKAVEMGRIPFPRHYEGILKLDKATPGEQVKALRIAAYCPSQAPPVLISGPFGTGKTRLLAAATYFFLQEGKKSGQITRVLVCAHHQASADTFLECYFGIMKTDEANPWRVKLARITSAAYHLRSEQYASFYSTIQQFKKRSWDYARQDWLLIITTCLTAPNLRGVFPPGFFTHILLDEGAQAREPEAVAPLCLATQDTKIVIAGDSQQVGPALLVLGKEARENGLKTSLLERLYERYRTSQVALQSCAKLLTNYRCHSGILDLSSRLFYESSLKCQVPDSIAHPSARYPLQFICLSDTEAPVVIPNDSELQEVIQQVHQCVQRWPVSWGNKDLKRVCVVTPTRSQIAVLRRLAQRKRLKALRMLPTYDIQGQEFLAVFLNTSEPVWEDWSTRNPTKSICDPFVFNTVLTRAKALVVAVGNPFNLLRSEQHMVRRYGEKGRCWSEFLKCCLQHNTLHAMNPAMQKRCRARLEDALLNKTSQASSSLKGSCKARSSTLNQGNTTRPAAALQGSHPKMLNVVLATGALKGTKTSSPLRIVPACSRQVNPPAAAVHAANTGASRSPQKAFPQLRPYSGSESQTKSSGGGSGSSSAGASRSPQKAFPELRPDSGSGSQTKSTGSTSADHSTPVLQSSSVYVKDYPSLEVAKKRVPKKESRDMQQAQPVTRIRNQQQFIDFYKQNKDKLNLDVIKKELTRENYKEKFQHLLCWEEKEHERILTERCDGANYLVTIFKLGYKPPRLDDYNEDSHLRYGLISLADKQHGDVMSYAKQASEGSQVFLSADKSIQVDHVYAGVPNWEDARSIVIALTVKGVKDLQRWDPQAVNYFKFQAEFVRFKLKHSYFQRLQQNIERLSPDIVAKIMPDTVHFTGAKIPATTLPNWYQNVRLDGGQLRALEAITCDSQAPVLVVGPFGTGKTRLLARAAFQILKEDREHRVLVCAHHQASVDTFVEYFGEMKKDPAKPWWVNFLRIMPNKSYRSNTRNKFNEYFKTMQEVKRLRRSSYRLVVSTLGKIPFPFGNGFFTHILLDEGAQTREPELVGPLCLADKSTKIVIAGDHFQVGPRLLVLGDEVQKYGLGVSILERLHKSYQNLGGVAQPYCVTLLTNYRCHSGILMLPSSLYYGSSLQCRVPEEAAHPDFPFPLVFVCTSLDIHPVDFEQHRTGTDQQEAEVLLEQVEKCLKDWPLSNWGDKVPSEVCIMSPSADQGELIRQKIRQKDTLKLKDVELLKAYDIQGRQYRAIFIGTCEALSEEGKTMNPTKSICDRYVFNTALTRAQSLVVAVGNPFTLLRMESHMVQKYGEQGKCWSEYIRRCLECKTFYPPSGHRTQSLKDFQHAKELLYAKIYAPDSSSQSGNHDVQTKPSHDSILVAYQQAVEEIPGCKKTKLSLNRSGRDLSWNLKSIGNEQPQSDIGELEERSVEKSNTVRCTLRIKHYRMAEAVPVNPEQKVINVSRPQHRRGAFDGDTVLAQVFPDNPPGKYNGRIVKTLESIPNCRFICTVFYRNAVIFCPVDKKNSLIVNLPRLSRAILTLHNKDEISDKLKSTDVVVFKAASLETIKAGKLPEIQTVVPLSVAKSMLFIVHVLHWNTEYRLPLGIVVGAVPKGVTSFEAERLLRVVHEVEFDEQECAESSEHLLASDSQRQLHLPLYDRAFTIDPENAVNLDDAVSLKLVNSTDNSSQYELAVHIVNAAKHIQEGSIQDRKAKQLGTSVYAGVEGKTMHMLPPVIRRQLTLHPGSIRDVISIVATVLVDNSSGRISMEGTISTHESQLKSSIKLSYQTAQQVMENQQLSSEVAQAVSQYDATAGQPSLAQTLQLLYKMAFSLRQERLTSLAAYSYEVEEPEEKCCWQTHLMIEELMIWANSVVADCVYSRFRDTALVRRQGGPNDEELAAVVTQQSSVMGYSHNLQQFTTQSLDTLPFLIPTLTLREIGNAIRSGNRTLLVNLLTSDHLYPQLAVAHTQLRSLQQRAEYYCTSREDSRAALRHHSLKLDLYTHFTSPMRRYIDIQLQRMLLASTSDAASSTTSSSTEQRHFNRECHQSLCRDLNSRNSNAKDFEKGMKKLALAHKYTSSSQVMEGFIVSTYKGAVELCFPDLSMKPLSFSEKKFQIKHLGSLGKSTGSSGTSDTDELTWRVKMTSLQPDFEFQPQGLGELQKEEPKRKKRTASHARQESHETSEKELTIVRFEMAQEDQRSSRLRLVNYSATVTPLVIKLDPKVWRKAMEFVQNPTPDNLETIKDDFTPASKDWSPAAVPEKPKCTFLSYHLKRSLSPYDSVKVWMSYSTREAYLMPKLQLVELAPGLRICLEHNIHPAECFSDPVLKNASQTNYNDIREYVGLWEKILLAEASEKSVKERQPVIIQDVSLDWPELVRPEGMDQDHFEARGEVLMELPTSFIEERSEFFNIRVGDMVCARYGTDPHSEARAVFHMVVSPGPGRTREKTKPARKEAEPQESEQVHMKFISKEQCRVSEKMKTLLKTRGATCEMQIVTMSTSYQRVYKSLMKMLPRRSAHKGGGQNAENWKNQLAQNIALGNVKLNTRAPTWKDALSILHSDPLACTLWSSNGSPSARPKLLNNVQLHAMELALTNEFQLIQGPPGTGKSETGAHIAYVFAMLNRALPDRQSVLYCGPSNKAVDVVLENLHCLNERHPELKLKILRIYGRAVERRKYPGPFWNKSAFQMEQSQYEVPTWAYEYLLHVKIRQKDTPACRELGEMDEEFKKQSEDDPHCIATSAERMDYKSALSSAEKEVLREQFDIILCTCNETASGRMSRGNFFTVRQCIIDECGMAFEPESMAPISLAEHVVLLGDHKQLQPVISYPSAREHGLARSLFQRYAEGLEGFCHTLRIQYRMHEGICEFPSNCFYKGVLETDTSVKARTNRETRLKDFWPRGPRMPILFCDTVGREGEVRAGSKGDRNIGIGSKFNSEEAKKVVEIAGVLHRLHAVRLEEMAILTPYSAQRDEIRKLAVEGNLLEEIKAGESPKGIKVASITESQGDEYGIVILSTVRSQPIADIANPDHVQADRGWLLENVGFVSDEHQINVGITRSKYGLVIVGNKRLLKYDVTWEKLLEHYEQQGCVVDGRGFPKKKKGPS